nr:MEIOTIC F-BOX protein MOF-like [Lolium perenne]
MSLDKIFQLDIQDYALPSLAVASIADPDKYAGKYRFLKSLRKARVLELRSFTTVGLLEDEPEGLRNFRNLRTLILIECEIGDRCQMVRYILENVPNLERLVLQDCKISGHCRGQSASSWCGTSFHGCQNLSSIRVKYEGHDVPLVLVDVLTEIAKDVVRTHHGKRNYVSWHDWMSSVVGWQKNFLRQRYGAAASAAAVESHNSFSDEEHESYVWKHRAGKKHDRDCAVKARRRAAHLARR